MTNTSKMLALFERCKHFTAQIQSDRVWMKRLLMAGDDIKTLQENMGHYSAAFTLDRYGHVTETMRKASSDRMQRFIEAL